MGKSYTFQHNKNIVITQELYNYVYKYKKELLLNITNLFNDLNIRFVISHGNLIEYERKKPIYHDDDLDIRYNLDDIHKWEKFCNENDRILSKYNLIFDNRFNNIERQKYNGIQAELINIPFECEHNQFKIHIDVVPNKTGISFWCDYDIDYNNLRKIKYLEIDTYAPNVYDTKKVLEKQYGENYIIPHINKQF